MMQKYFTREQALQKVKSYCAYQERCHKEVKYKLYEMGMHQNDVEEMMAQLIEQNYLNEERFAIQFAGGRFRVKQWGRNKIRYELKQKQVSAYCINKAIKSIDEYEYAKTLQKLFHEKEKTVKNEKNIFIKRKKIQDYLLQKGFESELIRELFGKH